MCTYIFRKAIEEIFRDTAKASVRAEKAGPSGWLPCPLLKTNKRFLGNTLKSVLTHNKRKTEAASVQQFESSTNPKRAKRKTEKELDDIIAKGQLRTAKFGQRKHCFRKVEKKKSI